MIDGTLKLTSTDQIYLGSFIPHGAWDHQTRRCIFGKDLRRAVDSFAKAMALLLGKSGVGHGAELITSIAAAPLTWAAWSACSCAMGPANQPPILLRHGSQRRQKASQTRATATPAACKGACAGDKGGNNAGKPAYGA